MKSISSTLVYFMQYALEVYCNSANAIKLSLCPTLEVDIQAVFAGWRALTAARSVIGRVNCVPVQTHIRFQLCLNERWACVTTRVLRKAGLKQYKPQKKNYARCMINIAIELLVLLLKLCSCHTVYGVRAYTTR